MIGFEDESGVAGRLILAPFPLKFPVSLDHSGLVQTKAVTTDINFQFSYFVYSM